MKTVSNNLFLLIRSLSGQEKRYFKLYASRHIIGDKNKYLLLFDAIEKQKEYDEPAIKQQFKNETFTRQLTVIKNYLYEMVLRSLDAYYAESTVDNQLKKQVHYVEILYNKGLYTQCEQLLQRAEKTAEQHEKYLLLLELSLWRLKLIKASRFYKTTEEELEELHNQQLSSLNKLGNYYAYDILNNKLYLRVMKKGWVSRNESEIKNDYTSIIDNELYAGENKALSANARALYYGTLSVYYYLKGEFYTSNEHSKKFIEVFEQAPYLVDDNPDEYIAGIRNLLFTSISLGNYDQVMENIARLKALNVKTEILQARVFTAAYLPELIVCNITERHDKARSLVGEVEQNIQLYRDHLSPSDILYLRFNAACVFFKIRDFKEALRFLSLITNSTEARSMPDIYANALLLNIIVQYELEAFDILPYILRTTYLFLLKQKRLYQFEKIVLSFIRKLTDIPKAGMAGLLKQAKTEFLALADSNPYEKYAMEHIGFLKWLDTKIDRL